MLKHFVEGDTKNSHPRNNRIKRITVSVNGLCCSVQEHLSSRTIQCMGLEYEIVLCLGNRAGSLKTTIMGTYNELLSGPQNLQRHIERPGRGTSNHSTAK